MATSPSALIELSGLADTYRQQTLSAIFENAADDMMNPDELEKLTVLYDQLLTFSQEQEDIPAYFDEFGAMVESDENFEALNDDDRENVRDAIRLRQNQMMQNRDVIKAALVIEFCEIMSVIATRSTTLETLRAPEYEQNRTPRIHEGFLNQKAPILAAIFKPA